MTKQQFNQLTGMGTVLLDGATGSNLMNAGMPQGVCTEAWITDHKDILISLQRAYMHAGSQIVYAPTFAANRYSLGNHGLDDQTERLNKTLAAISKEAVGDHCYVAGDLTTTGRLMEPQGDMTYEQLLGLYSEQITYLAAAGVDLLVAETMLSMVESMAALDAAQSVCDLPIMCTLTVESDGSLFTGGNIYENVAVLQELGASAVGINCSVGPDQLEAVVANMKQISSIPIIVKPNAGIPAITASGQAVYNMTKEAFAENMLKLIEAGADIVGGCCGTSPEYIQELGKRIHA